MRVGFRLGNLTLGFASDIRNERAGCVIIGDFDSLPTAGGSAPRGGSRISASRPARK